MVNMEDPQEVALQFGAMILGATYEEGPPPPGSPLARAIALREARDAGLITDEEFEEADERLFREALRAYDPDDLLIDDPSELWAD
jgi:hypothetical protein